MSDYLVLQTPLGISKLPEMALNTLKTLQADFETAVTSQLQLSLPEMGKDSNAGLVGSGHGYVTQHTNSYMGHPSMTMQDRLNTSLFSLYLARMLGGTITSTEVTTGVSYDHDIEVLAPTADPQLKSSTLVAKIGGLDVMLGGMVGNSLSISFADSAAPTFSAEFLGTGKVDYMSAQVPPLVMPVLTAQNYINTSASAQCSFNDGTLLSLHSVGRMQGLTINYSNDLITADQRVGDSFRVPGDPDSGAHVNQLTRKVPSASIQFTVYADANKREWLDHLNNTRISNFTYLAQGRKIGASNDRHEVEIIVPQGIFSSVQRQDTRDKHTFAIILTPELAAGEKGLIKGRIRNGSATLQ